jgi:glycosyltransferase involved in cell wall biosynthesis/peptidoglycan/xylan/chitin deacetylase (PgdA/CDA1 family)
MIINRIYYLLKPLLPWSVRVILRQRRADSRRAAFKHTWPIDERAGAAPPNWPGWPEGKQFAVVLTHDVEGPKGLQRVPQLMEVERRYGFRSSFNLVPEWEYRVPDELRHSVESAGFEVGVHGLEHDGKLYSSKAGFAAKAARIKEYLREWNASGFRSPLMQHRLSWLHQLGAEYDASTFDTDPFEPEPDGAGTIFPFWVPGPEGVGYVELPYTLVQDFTLFTILREPTIDVWKKKIAWIAARGGMVLLNVHPDYICFGGSQERDEFPVSHYEDFLAHLADNYRGQFWHALPKEVSRFYKSALTPDQRNTRRKICLVTNSAYETDSRVRDYAEALAKRGDQVDVVAICGPKGRMSTEIISGVTVYRVLQQGRSQPGKWTNTWHLLRFLAASSAQLTRNNKNTRYDLIHVHNMPDFLVFAAWHPKWIGAKLILDIRDMVPKNPASELHKGRAGVYGKLLRAIEKLSMRFADHVIVSNPLWQSTLTSRSAPDAKCSVFLDNGDSIVHQRTRDQAVHQFIVVAWGPFQRQQGLGTEIRAFARFREVVLNAEFHIYGCGDDEQVRKELAALAGALGLNESVKFLPSGPLDEIPQIIANADMGVISKGADGTGNEGYGAEIKEFMSLGVPVVASIARNDTFSSGESAVRFFTPGDEQGMARAMLDVSQDGKLRSELSENANKYADYRNWTQTQKQYFDLIDSLLTETFDQATAIAEEQTPQPGRSL